MGTCNELLKWKFAHLNSVDFLLRVSPSGGKICKQLRGASSATSVAATNTQSVMQRSSWHCWKPEGATAEGQDTW